MKGKNTLMQTRHQFELFEEDYAKLKAKADKHNLSINEYCRRKLRRLFTVNSHIVLDVNLKNKLDAHIKETGQTFEDLIKEWIATDTF